MTTTLVPSRPKRLPKHRIVLHGISWRDYELIGRVFQDRPIRITYDRGRMEIMTTSRRHEFSKHRLRKLIDALVEEFGLEMSGGGSMTFKRKEQKRGLEPDECFWIQNELVMRSKEEFDFEKDPPPDLVLEVEVSRSALDRMRIYAAFGVPEVWRCTRQAVRVCRLIDGRYEETESSLAFPNLNPNALLKFLEQHPDLGEVALIRQFREWIRQQIANNWPNGGLPSGA